MVSEPRFAGFQRIIGNEQPPFQGNSLWAALTKTGIFERQDSTLNARISATVPEAFLSCGIHFGAPKCAPNVTYHFRFAVKM